MKYILNESQINKLISSYLDSQDWWSWDIGDGEFDVTDGKDGDEIFKYRIQFSSTVPDHEFDVIYIDRDFIEKISQLFSIPEHNSIDVIIDWFNTKYDKNLTLDNFESFGSDTYYADDEDDEENY